MENLLQVKTVLVHELLYSNTGFSGQEPRHLQITYIETRRPVWFPEHRELGVDSVVKLLLDTDDRLLLLLGGHALLELLGRGGGALLADRDLLAIQPVGERG